MRFPSSALKRCDACEGESHVKNKMRGIFKQVTTSCYQVTMKSAKITVLWDMTPQHLARDIHSFLGVSCHHFQVGLFGLIRTRKSAAVTNSNFVKLAMVKRWLWLITRHVVCRRHLVLLEVHILLSLVQGFRHLILLKTTFCWLKPIPLLACIDINIILSEIRVKLMLMEVIISQLYPICNLMRNYFSILSARVNTVNVTLRSR
jgi:hypothetical protein